ncbi:MAG: two-component regulator propeller domain-containing protein, partial [Chloracidobacterium sp.]
MVTEHESPSAILPVATGYVPRRPVMWPVVRLIGILLWLFGAAQAEVRSTSSFEYLTQENGLSNNAVHCILQDRRGFLWIGTEDGLNRYDGFTFKVYRNQAGNPGSLPGNFVRSLYESRDGTLWFGFGRAGFCRYDAKTDTFFRYEVKSPRSGVHANTFQFYEDRQGRFWVCTDLGLVRVDRQRDDFRLYDLTVQGFTDSGVLDICEDSTGQLWIGATNGLLRFDADSEKAHLILPPGRYRTSSGSTERFGWRAHGVTPEGWLCLSFGRAGMALFDPARERLIEQFDYTGKRLDALPAELPRATPETVILSWDGPSVWMRCPDGTLRELNLQNGVARMIQAEPKRPDGLGGQNVDCMLRDRSGVLWFGDSVAGLIKFSPTRNRFERHQHRPADETSLSNNYVRGICEDRLGRVWVATQFGGLNCLDRQTGRATRYRARPNDPTALRSDQVWSVLEDRQGTLWVGTLDGLQSLDPETGRFHSLPALPDRIQVNLVYEDARQRLWVASPQGIYEISPDRRSSYNHAPNLNLVQAAGVNPQIQRGLGVDVQALHVSPRDGHLWIGLPNGAIRYDPDQKTYRVYRVDSRPEYGEPYVTHFTEGRDGTLWMVTKGAGLCRFDPQRETFTHLLEQDGLPHNNCYA